MKVKEESQDLNEVEEKHQDQKIMWPEKNQWAAAFNIADVKKPFTCSQCGERVLPWKGNLGSFGNSLFRKAFQLLSVWKHLQT